MPATSFRRKKYGMVKPVKVRKVKPPRPDVRELARYYKAIAKFGVWQQLDAICYAMAWWVKAIEWFNAITPKEVITTNQARVLAAALKLRKEGLAAKSDKEKIKAFIAAIYKLEHLTDLKVPPLSKSIAEGETMAKKNKAVLDRMEPRFQKITGLISAMFRTSPISLVVVPRIVDPVTGKSLDRKIDHTRNTMYYSRDYAKKMMRILRKEGVLSLALTEAFWLSRAMAYWAFDQHFAEKRFEYYIELMDSFYMWVVKSPDAPKQLVKRMTKQKKPKVKSYGPSFGVTAAFVAAVEQSLQGEVADVQPIPRA